MKFLRLFLAIFLGISLTSALLLGIDLLGGAPLASGGKLAVAQAAGYPAGATIIPLGSSQAQLRTAYQKLFETIYAGQPVAWTASDSNYAGKTYPPGTLLGVYGVSGNFTSVDTDGSYQVQRAHALRPARIAVLYSQVKDYQGQFVSWEEASFETFFRVYLWGDYFKTVNEADIRAGRLADYDILILPSVTLDYADNVSAALGAEGRTAIAQWVTAGGTIYAQGEACFIVEAAGLTPAGTVDPLNRLTDTYPYDNVAHLTEVYTTHPLAYSWLAAETYVLDDPVLKPTQGMTVIAKYKDTSRPNTPAILYRQYGKGQVILTNAHPSGWQYLYPMVFDALFMGMSERAGLSARVKQELSDSAADTLIPAYEADIPIRLTIEARNYWDVNISDIVLTETVNPGFVVHLADVAPAPSAFITSTAGTKIVWNLSSVPPGAISVEYLARTLTGTLASGEAAISASDAVYLDPLSGKSRRISRSALDIEAKMAARLNGDRDIELDGLYPLPAEGYYFDIALTLENKEETSATHIIITDVVALLSPIVDVDDQRLIPIVIYPAPVSSTLSETVWVENEVFFYNNATYPLPDGVTSRQTVFNLSNWDGVTVYTYTNELHNPVTIPAAYSQYISVTANGEILLPALVLTYTFGDMQPYDYLDPAARYGIFSRELLHRQVSFASDPMTETGVVLSTSGGSVFTNLGGHPIPYHEYLSKGIITIPEPPVTTTVAYQDMWERPQAMPLRTVFYDIVPFPPPEYHAVVNTTYELNVDWDGDGKRTDAVLEYPSRLPADLHLMLKSHSNFDPTMPPLRKDETLISQGMFKGLGYTISPYNGDWALSWSFRDLQQKGAEATVLTDVINSPAYTYLYFQQELDSQAYEVIDITATLNTVRHREGVIKINDGARFVYHQKAVGPSRYEVFDSHVQAVFGLRSDVKVSKQVAPVRIATYADHVYHFIRLEDPWEPREFTEDPFIQSYGFGDMAATVYVGGRHQRNLLWSRVNPGEATQVRIEINNNTGVTLTNVSLVPSAPPGFTVSLRSYTETTKIEPIFFDFPFLNVTDIPDAWKGVYYFDVSVANPFPSPRGQVYTITFTLQGDNIPAKFSIPAAKIGVKDSAGSVQTVWGPSTELALTDYFPSWVSYSSARIANEAEMTAMVDAINYDEANPGSNTAWAYYTTLRGGITTEVLPWSSGKQVNFTLPSWAQTMPWKDRGALSKVLYVIAYSSIKVNWSGTATADYAPMINYKDYFSQMQLHFGKEQTVEAHGALLSTYYWVSKINGALADPGEGVLPGYSELAIEGRAVNSGDDIAADVYVTYTLPAEVALLRVSPQPLRVTDSAVCWQVGDLAPGAYRSLNIVVVIKPGYERINKWELLISRSDSAFRNVYAQQPVKYKTGGGLSIKVNNPVVYAHNFETSVGSEWSSSLITATLTGRKFLGDFSNQNVRLTLLRLPHHTSGRLSLDLYLLRSWDGNQITYTFPTGASFAPNGWVGPDQWKASVDRRVLLYTTFSNWDLLGFHQAFPGSYPGGDYPARTGAVENNSLGYFFSYYMDSVYHLEFFFKHSSSDMQLDFQGMGLQGLEDESWGIDNIEVSVSAAPWVYIPVVRR